MRISIVGGTGKLGVGLALRWGRSHEVSIGSRQREKGEEAAEKCRKMGIDVSGGKNEDVVRECDVVVLTIPYSALELIRTLPISSQIIICPIVPMEIRRKSVAEEVREILPESARLVSSLHTVSYDKVMDISNQLSEDVLVCGDDPESKKIVHELLSELGLRPIDFGGIENSIFPELLGLMLIRLSRVVKRSLGIRFV